MLPISFIPPENTQKGGSPRLILLAVLFLERVYEHIGDLVDRLRARDENQIVFVQIICKEFHNILKFRHDDGRLFIFFLDDLREIL